VVCRGFDRRDSGSDLAELVVYRAMVLEELKFEQIREEGFFRARESEVDPRSAAQLGGSVCYQAEGIFHLGYSLTSRNDFW
jgi:hypothetical protein